VKSTIKIEFDSDEAAKAFMRWLDGQGEQDYWTWQDGAESNLKGNVTALRFDYDFDNLTIQTECGRLSDK
jgi:hypothetical protein